jgi:fructose-bisphosphate aldolase class II
LEKEVAMTLTNVLPWIQRAFQQGWAVGAFNTVNMEQAQAIAWAAEAEAAPAIIQVSHRALLYSGDGDAERGLRMMAGIGKAAAESVMAPVSLHLDHATESEVLLALELGFTSVMFDAADLPLDENITITRRLAGVARAHEACLEAEVGEVPKPSGDELVDPRAGLTDPEDAYSFASLTGVDILAIAIGSVHSGKVKTVELDLDRLQAIRARVSVPLVLHGSSGVTDTSLRAGIALGLAKVIVATQLSQGFTAGAREVLTRQPSEVDLRPYLGAGRSAMIEVVRERIRVLGASGKARSA